jgi:DNA-binding CsgD family transcriptional regulator
MPPTFDGGSLYVNRPVETTPAVTTASTAMNHALTLPSRPARQSVAPPPFPVPAGRPNTPLLPRSDCEQLLELTARLFSLSDPAVLPIELLRGLEKLIPCELAGCHHIHPASRRIRACYLPEPARPPSRHPAFWRLFSTHPLHERLFSRPATAWKLSDAIAPHAFHSTDLYHALYHPLAIQHELAAALRDPVNDGAWLLITLHRHRNDFSERDRTTLNLLLPHIDRIHRRLGSEFRPPAPPPTVLREEGEFFTWLRGHTSWGLTRRESDVLFWICQGKTNAEIGSILGIARRTAETHALKLYPKMGVENRYTAIATLNRYTAIDGSGDSAPNDPPTGGR